MATALIELSSDLLDRLLLDFLRSRTTHNPTGWIELAAVRDFFTFWLMDRGLQPPGARAFRESLDRVAGDVPRRRDHAVLGLAGLCWRP